MHCVTTASCCCCCTVRTRRDSAQDAREMNTPFVKMGTKSDNFESWAQQLISSSSAFEPERFFHRRQATIYQIEQSETFFSFFSLNITAAAVPNMGREAVGTLGLGWRSTPTCFLIALTRRPILKLIHYILQLSLSLFSFFISFLERQRRKVDKVVVKRWRNSNC